MFKTIRRWLCRHRFTWVERRGREVCMDCGHAKPKATRERGGA